MIDFAKMAEVQRKRQRAFEAWIKTAWPNGDWNKLTQHQRDLIDLAFRRGFGQGFIEGQDYDTQAG